MSDIEQTLKIGQELDALSVDDSSSGTVTALSTLKRSTIRLTAASTLQGMANGSSGKLIWLVNATGSPITVADESSGATAANRILTGFGSNLTVNVDQQIALQYDATASRWRIYASGGRGPQGVQGAQGQQGSTGSAGAQGQQGFQGVQGSQGAQGFQGFQGNQGFQGFQGAQGSNIVTDLISANVTINSGETMDQVTANIASTKTVTVNGELVTRIIKGSGSVAGSGVISRWGNV